MPCRFIGLLRLVSGFLLGSLILGPLSVLGQTVPREGIIPDPLLEEQWYLERTRATAAWELTRGDPRVIIAVLDSGVDLDNSDLKPNIWINTREVPANGYDDDGNGYVDDVSGWDFVRSVPDPRPKFDGEWSVPGMQHGTLIAGIAAARGGNGEGISGMAPLATILPLRVLDGGGEGKVEHVVAAIDYAIRAGASIINLSFVGEGESRALTAAVRRAWEAGLVVVAAAGNEQQSGPIDLDKTPLAPACSEDGDVKVLGVTAVDEGDHRAHFANTGKKCIDLAAPGTNIFSTELRLPDNPRFFRSYGGWWSGTSLAVGVVAGAAALVRSFEPNLSNREVVTRLLEGADPVSSAEGAIGVGRVNVLRALLGGVKSRQSETVPLAFHGLAVANRRGTIPRVMILRRGDSEKATVFRAGPKNETDGTNLVVADLDGDGQPEVITTPAFPKIIPKRKAGEVKVRIWTHSGKAVREFVAWRHAESYGSSLATGDVNGDGLPEIIVGSSQKTAAKIRIFRADGERILEIVAWPAPAKPGVVVASADIDVDGFAEIFALPADGVTAELRTFAANGRFLASASLTLKGEGAPTLAVGDLNEDGQLELAIGSAEGSAPHVRLLTTTGKVIRLVILEGGGALGAVAALGDSDGDGRLDLMAYPRSSTSRRLPRLSLGGRRLKSIVLPFALTPHLAVF